MINTTPQVQRRLHHEGGLCLHYREAGAPELPHLVLLHPSPRSSAMYEPWMTLLAPHFHVLALDTPGYGGSDPLPTPSPNSVTPLADYLAPLHDWLQTVAGPQCLLYGSATGAQLGIAFANRHPGAVKHLMLDNAAHFDDAERAHILAHYFPDLSPRSDGSHLLTAWRMAAQMAQFFPWFEDNEAHRVSSRSPTALEVHAAVAELLAAGPHYARAYRAAFEHEHAEHLMSVQVPTTVLRWKGSVLLKHIDRLLTFDLPPNVRCLDTPADMPARYAAMTQHLLALR